MTTSSFPISLVATVLLLLLSECSHLALAFSLGPCAYHSRSCSARTTTTTTTETCLKMGLYDTPLPPPPQEGSGKNGRGNNDDDDDGDDEELLITHNRLFQFNKFGNEIANLLPPLGRRMLYGIVCYYEITDRKVKVLAQQASCHPKDAAWALEACKGDVMEARTRIAVAQRMSLERQKEGIIQPQSTKEKSTTKDSKGGNKEADYLKQIKADLYDLLLEDEFQERKEKEKQAQEEKLRKGSGFFTNGPPGSPGSSGKDADWLPLDNPKPVDDEPWFTG